MKKLLISIIFALLLLPFSASAVSYGEYKELLSRIESVQIIGNDTGIWPEGNVSGSFIREIIGQVNKTYGMKLLNEPQKDAILSIYNKENRAEITKSQIIMAGYLMPTFYGTDHGVFGETTIISTTNTGQEIQISIQSAIMYNSTADKIEFIIVRPWALVKEPQILASVSPPPEWKILA